MIRKLIKKNKDLVAIYLLVLLLIGLLFVFDLVFSLLWDAWMIIVILLITAVYLFTWVYTILKLAKRIKQIKHHSFKIWSILFLQFVPVFIILIKMFFLFSLDFVMAFIFATGLLAGY